MQPFPDPLRAYADAVRAEDRPLAEAIARRLYPWVRRPATVADVPAAARQLVHRLARTLGL